ncbi:MAG: ATP-binding cassette domain-containing protein [Clostridiales bacterium]|jgi:multiple sugar transport system ATP-binding protein|nr:ATP-binding cassette domain-containing protein [Clostridiales bacterium]
MKYLEVEKLSKKFLYGEQALDGVSFSLDRGERLTVFGDSCAGKTALVKTVLGLFEKSGGSIRLGGRDIAEIPFKERGFSSTFFDAFKRRKSVYENLFYSFRLRGIERSVFEEKLRIADGFFNTKNLLFKEWGDLSPREKALAVIVRCVLRGAELYLFDDPLKGLAFPEKKEILLRLSAYLDAAVGGAVLYTTGDLLEAEFLNQKTLILNYGTVAAYGDLKGIFAAPPDLYCCRLFGFNVLKRDKYPQSILQNDLNGNTSAQGDTEYQTRSILQNDLNENTFVPNNAVFFAVKPKDLHTALTSGAPITGKVILAPFDVTAPTLCVRDADETTVWVAARPDGEEFRIGGEVGLRFSLSDALFYGADEKIITETIADEKRISGTKEV